MQINVVEPTLNSCIGHCYGYVLSILDSQDNDFTNIRLKLWVGKGLKKNNLLPGRDYIPYFNYKIRKIQLYFLYKSLLKKNQHIFIPTAGMSDLIILNNLVKKFRPTSSIHLHFHQFNLNYKKQKRLLYLSNNNFHIMTPTPGLSKIFIDHGFLKVSTVPCPVFAPKKYNINSTSNDEIKALYTGAARKDKGFNDLVKFIEQTSMDINFHIQAPKPHNGHYDQAILPSISLLKKLMQTKKNLSVSYESPSQEAFQMLFINSITLLLYEKKEYENKFSGILLDSLYMGAPVIATEGTWFSSIVSEYNCGIIIKSTDRDDIEYAITKLTKNYAQYSRRALDAGNSLYIKHNPKNTLISIIKHSSNDS